MQIIAALLFVQQAVVAPGAPAYAGRGAPDVQVPRVDAVIAIDGVLDEPAWSGAAVLSGFSQYEPVDGRPAAERTEVLVWYAADAIHFGIRAYDREPGAIRATVADRDNIDGDDHVVLYLDTFDDRRRAFFFGVNPLGVQQDGVRTEGASTPGRMFGGDTDRSPDYYFESAGRLTGDGYVVEVRIPFKSLRFPSDDPQRWGLQVERKVQRTGYTDTWTDARRASASFLGQAGTLVGLADLDRGIVLEAQPVVTASADGVRNATTGGFDRASLEPELGVNLRVGFSSLSLDATVNPDFSQIEADAGQVTANERFALFFAEKRPFFLEGIELFSTPNQLVYTRRIADPVVGGKVSGKVGGISVAHLTAWDDVPEVDGDDALFNVTRLRRDFGRSSYAGVTFTDRDVPDADAYNRVLAADVRHVFGGMYFAEAQLGRSWSRDGGGSRDAPIWKLTADRTGRRWGFNWSINGIGEAFEARSGFVPRAGIVDGHIFNRISFYGAPGAWLERITIFAGPTRLWRYDEFTRRGAAEGTDSFTGMFRLRGGWELDANISRNFYELDPAAYAAMDVAAPGGPAPYRPLDRVSGPSFEIGGNTPTYRRLDANATATLARLPIFAEGSEGSAATLRGELGLRPTDQVRIALSNTLQRITRTRDAVEFARTVIPRLKAEYQPTRALFFRVVGEYRSERRAALVDARTGAPLLEDGAPVAATRSEGLRVDLLASFEPTPGTVAFLGYGTSMVAPDAFAFGRLDRVSDGLFLKLAYQFRR